MPLNTYMQKRVFILFAILAGFLLVPGSSYACSQEGTAVEASCHQNGNTCDVGDQACCVDHHSKKGPNDDCDGQCGHNACHCPSVCPIAIPYISAIEPFTFGGQKQLSLFHFALSSGFHSIWQPPKIS